MGIFGMDRFYANVSEFRVEIQPEFMHSMEPSPTGALLEGPFQKGAVEAIDHRPVSRSKARFRFATAASTPRYFVATGLSTLTPSRLIRRYLISGLLTCCIAPVARETQRKVRCSSREKGKRIVATKGFSGRITSGLRFSSVATIANAFTGLMRQWPPFQSD